MKKYSMLLLFVGIISSGCANREFESRTYWSKEASDRNQMQYDEKAKDKEYKEKLFTSFKNHFPQAINLPGLEDVNKSFVSPRMTNSGTPSYPESLIRDGVTGTVFVALLIGENGLVIDTKIVKTTNEALNDSAIQSTKVIRFTPALLNNKPCRAVVIAPISFTPPK